MVSLSAFTLVEILVVVALISVLAILVTRSLPNFLGGAAKAQCAGNMRSLGVAIHQYAQDNDGYLPPLVTDWDKSWPYLLISGGYASPEIFRCPTARTAKSPSNAQKGYGQNPPCDYAYNAMLGAPQWGTASQKKKLLKADFPAEAALVVDGIDYGWFWEPWGNPFQSAPWGNLDFRHSDGMNVLFLDGHVDFRRKRKSDYPAVRGDDYYFWDWAIDQ